MTVYKSATQPRLRETSLVSVLFRDGELYYFGCSKQLQYSFQVPFTSGEDKDN